jgi:hypothetical protein
MGVLVWTRVKINFVVARKYFPGGFVDSNPTCGMLKIAG